MIEEGKLDREQLKGFVGQFYLFFPKPFPKPIAAMLSRCPDDPEMEKMWIENVVEEGTGEITGTDSHKALFIRFAGACGYSKEELDRVEPLPETEAFLDWRELLMYPAKLVGTLCLPRFLSRRDRQRAHDAHRQRLD